MQIQENFSLKPYHTFRIDVKARYFSAFTNIDDLVQLTTTDPRLTTHDSRLMTFILGGGSNILFTKNYDGLVAKNEIMGIEKIKEDNEHVYIRSGAGENWHQFVLYCIQNNYSGVENLSLIPGCVGATPMQNIGAYGVEVKEIFYELEAFHQNDKGIIKFGLSDCEFGYRDSIFKHRYKNQFVILNVTYRLNKKPNFNTSYGAIEDELKKMGVNELNIRVISQAVINIRSSKLPDPSIIGNAGSFFKNPEVSNEKFEKLKTQFLNIVGYKNINDTVKLAAAWLIEQCGWKGYRRGDAGVHPKQALVLVNYDNASGSDIYDLSEEILQSVKEKFGVVLEREVNVI
ncbi:MAG: UDP-N-acetylmuramate dehydrogenase [Bacteroidota bacterium]|nr:UDP-N-acetylmuramate dehydrogenase [Bacteroidota bacterium]